MPAKKKREEEESEKKKASATTTTTKNNQKREEETKKKTLLPRNYHLKKSLVKKLEILAKYERLKETPGKLEKELAKRRKKASQRGQKFMPRTRR
jgi:hypothetical protein